LGELTRLQSIAHTGTARLSSSEFIENVQVDDGLVERLQSTLSKERERIFGGLDRRRLPAADTNVIELVGMLFEYMLKEEHLPNIVKALLSRLHTPLLKVSVMDRTFFTRTQHPARKLLNDMTAAGIHWVDEKNIERGIFPKMKEIVDRVLLEFEEDAGIFDLFVQDFAKALDELKQRARLVEQRNAEAADGQDKLQAARSRAQEEISKLAAAAAAPDAARDVMQRLWADRLTFSLLRNPEGERSADWQEEVTLARHVADSLAPPASDGVREKRRETVKELQQKLRQRAKTMQHTDKEKLLSKLFEYQEQALLAPAPQAEPEPAAPPAPVETAEQTAPDSLTPAQSAVIAKLKSIPFGTWFEFHTDENAGPQRAKLSWRSTITEKFMFVDHMGVKAAVVSMRELADCMISGKVRIIQEDKKPFVDRALQAIHRMLDHGTRQKASA
jgi:hypothetical protein